MERLPFPENGSKTEPKTRRKRRPATGQVSGNGEADEAKRDDGQTLTSGQQCWNSDSPASSQGHRGQPPAEQGRAPSVGQERLDADHAAQEVLTGKATAMAKLAEASRSFGSSPLISRWTPVGRP